MLSPLEIIDLMPEPILEVDLEGSIVLGNLAAAAALNRPRRTLPGLRLSAFVAETSHALREYLARCARNGQFLTGTLTLVSPGRSTRCRVLGAASGPMTSAFHAGSVLLRLEPAAAQGAAFVALNEKIRELHAEIKRRQLLEESLRAADRQKDEFLATMAHELRNPLAPIRNALQVMSLRPDAAQGARLQKIAERQLGFLARLLDDLLDASRITQGRFELRRERVTIDAIVELAAETAAPWLQSKGQHLRVECASPPPLLDADATRLAQVLSNLIHNSSKFSPAGSEIRLRTMRQQEFVVVQVSDCGAGIPAEMLERIFDMFTQVPRPGREGLGIGLTLARRIAQLHGGTISAVSAGEGLGSTFTVRLPTASQLQAAVTDVTGTAPLPVARGRVLIADDNPDAAETLAMMLEIEGHEVRIAHDGQEALRLAEAFRPRVAILDIGMPKLDGYETARLLRARPWARDIALVALTGWGQEHDRQQSCEAGFNEHWVKPVDPHTFLAQISRLLQRCQCHESADEEGTAGANGVDPSP